MWPQWNVVSLPCCCASLSTPTAKLVRRQRFLPVRHLCLKWSCLIGKVNWCVVYVCWIDLAKLSDAIWLIATLWTRNTPKLDSLRWFSQRCSHRQVLCACYIRCNVSPAHMALFTFCVMRHDSAKWHIFGGCAPRRGLWPPNSYFAEIFV